MQTQTPSTPGISPALALFNAARPMPGESYVRSGALSGVPFSAALLRSIDNDEPCGVHVTKQARNGYPVSNMFGVKLNVFAEINGFRNYFVEATETHLFMREPSLWVGNYAEKYIPVLSVDLPAVWTWLDDGEPVDEPRLWVMRGAA